MVSAIWHKKHSILHGLHASLTRRKIKKYQQQLGNGHDSELYQAIAEQQMQLGHPHRALESYRRAAGSLRHPQRPLEHAESERLIHIYRRILRLCPSDGDTAENLGREYQRRGMEYRAVSLYTSMAEHYAAQGNYDNAIRQYHRVIAIESGSITARDACARLYCHLGDYEHAAAEYREIADIFFQHQKFDGALQYYQQAQELVPDNEAIREQIVTTRHILEGTVILPEYDDFNTSGRERMALKHSLEEKEQLEQHLRHKISLLEQRHQQTVAQKNRQLQAARERLEKLSTYVAVFKHTLEQVTLEKQHLTKQVENEAGHIARLEEHLATLNILYNSLSEPAGHTQEARRVTRAMKRLRAQKQQIEQHIQADLEHRTHHEKRLHHTLAHHETQGSRLERQIALITRERQHIEQNAREQFRQSLEQEQSLEEQITRLIEQHTQAMQQVEEEKQKLEDRCHTTQQHVQTLEQQHIQLLEQLQDELSRQCEQEGSVSRQFHESLVEMSSLLHTQEQEIEKLESLEGVFSKEWLRTHVLPSRGSDTNTT